MQLIQLIIDSFTTSPVTYPGFYVGGRGAMQCVHVARENFLVAMPTLINSAPSILIMGHSLAC